VGGDAAARGSTAGEKEVDMMWRANGCVRRAALAVLVVMAGQGAPVPAVAAEEPGTDAAVPAVRLPGVECEITRAPESYTATLSYERLMSAPGSEPVYTIAEAHPCGPGQRCEVEACALEAARSGFILPFGEQETVVVPPAAVRSVRVHLIE
jgi:hypothetical protein